MGPPVSGLASGCWAAVLKQAVLDLTGDIDDRFHRETFRYFARLWFESTNDDPPDAGPFVSRIY